MIQNNVKKYRTEKGFTQAQLSEKAGVTQAYLSQVENGKRAMSLEFAVKLAGLFGVKLDELVVTEN